MAGRSGRHHRAGPCGSNPHESHRATARTYLDDETIKDIAQRRLSGFVGERPGADPRCSRGLAGLILPWISGMLG